MSGRGKTCIGSQNLSWTGDGQTDAAISLVAGVLWAELHNVSPAEARRKRVTSFPGPAFHTRAPYIHFLREYLVNLYFSSVGQEGKTTGQTQQEGLEWNREYKASPALENPIFSHFNLEML